MRTRFGFITLVLLLPVFALAQASDSELQMTIRAALASDPRTNAMSPEALDALAAQLAEGAADRGMTPQDITWKPIESAPAAASEQLGCSIFPQYFCTISDSFGFMGNDPTIPVWLFATALMFLFVVGEMRYLHRKHLREAAAAKTPLTGMPPAPPPRLQS